jgi:hypothetical protein
MDFPNVIVTEIAEEWNSPKIPLCVPIAFAI